MTVKICIMSEGKPEEILNILKSIHVQKHINMDIFVFRDIFKLLCYCRKNKVSMVILNEEIGCSIDSYDLAYSIKSIDSDIMPVVISREKRISEKAGHVELFGYMAPESINFVLPDLIEYAERRIGINRNVLFCYFWNGKERRVDLDKILYFCSNHRIIEFKDLENNIGAFYRRLDEVEAALLGIGHFVRVGKSYLVNKNHILSMENKELILSNGEKIPVSKAYRKNMEEKVKI